MQRENITEHPAPGSDRVVVLRHEIDAEAEQCGAGKNHRQAF